MEDIGGLIEHTQDEIHRVVNQLDTLQARKPEVDHFLREMEYPNQLYTQGKEKGVLY